MPSKASEFAHPDVILGVSVLAYRYSGLRWSDFTEIVDGLTTDFSLEIGPARERASSIRYESWVVESGGSIRGVKLEGDRVVDADKEVVQLKYLQKSNMEQMLKLFALWKLHPQVS